MSAANQNHSLPEGLEPKTRRFLESVAKWGGPPIYTLPVDKARELLRGVQAGSIAKPPAEIEERTISAGPTGSVRLRIVRPKGAAGKLPTVMYFHGGGYVLCDFQTHERLVREIAKGVPAAVVFVDYDLAPEVRYPVPVEQGYAATKYVAEHGSELNLDSSRLAVAGDSAGGNMAAAVTLLAKERGGPKIDFQVLFYPATDANLDTGSYLAFADGPWLLREGMRWVWNLYVPDEKQRAEPTASPLRASLEQLKGLPPALIITAEFDVLRDEGEAYARKLAEAGVQVTSVRYNGTIHDFVMLNALADTPASEGGIAQACEALARALQT